jgi:aryl-alcohol dehydrogenase-like predicted oxidoreductase
VTPVALALGTVQFGIAYGVAGRGEAVPTAEARAILELGWDQGIRMLDTAPVYGDIEQRLDELAGAHEFTIVSKIPPLPPDVDADTVETFVRESVERSRTRLGDRLRVLLFHRGADLCAEHGERALAAARAASGPGIRLGASVYSPAEAVEVRSRLAVEIIQLPGNVLDQRLAQPGIATQLADVEIHLRSVLLQGLLLMPAEQGAVRVPAARPALDAWANYCRVQRLAPLPAALGAARSLPGVRHCVIGVDSVAHLQEICSAWRAAKPLHVPELASSDERVIDPRRWSTA